MDGGIDRQIEMRGPQRDDPSEIHHECDNEEQDLQKYRYPSGK